MQRSLIGSGSECKVYNIGGGVCYKRYATKQNAEVAFANAELAADAGIAPKVYRKGRKGYTTEIVELYKYICKHCEEDSSQCVDLCSRFIVLIGQKEYYEMTNIAQEVFGERVTLDFHNENIGCKNGKPVMIDFGYASGLN